MMRKHVMTTGIVALFSAVLSASGPAGAADSYGAAVVEKTAHGIFNVVMSPLEVLVQPIAWALDFERDERPGTGGLLIGLMTSPAAIAGRAVEGVFSLATFPIAVPGPDREFRLCQLSCYPATRELRLPPRSPYFDW
jgi:hypothetical protein